MERMTSPNLKDNQSDQIERTLALIKPDGMKYRDAIVKRIFRAGFHILQIRIVKLTAEQASEFYRDLYGTPNYPLLVVALTEGPIQAMCIAKPAAIKEWNALMGPENYTNAKGLWPGCLRSLFADPKDEFRNALHGSSNSTAAQHEIHFFFPNMILEPILEHTHQHRYLQGAVNPVLWDGLYQLAKVRPPDPLVWLAKWLIENNPYKPTITETSEKMLKKIVKIECDYIDADKVFDLDPVEKDKIDNLINDVIDDEQETFNSDEKCLCYVPEIVAKSLEATE